ncbi:MAG: YciI family protein [Myxococcota bacterium]
MRFMAIMYPGPQAEAGVMPDEKILTEMGNFNEELVKSGAMVSGEGLLPSARGARIRFPGGKAEVQRGPFTGSEIVGGFWILEFPSLDEAIATMSRCPTMGGEMIEIRKVAEAADFGDAFTPELQEQEERLRSEIAAQQGSKP